MPIKEVTLYNQFGGVIEKEASIPNLDPTFFYGSAQSATVTSEDVVTKPYQHHWVVYACTRAIAWNLSRLKKIFEDSTKKKIEDHETLDLLKRPNPFMTGRTFWEATILALLLPARQGYSSKVKGGQCFWICDSGKEDYHVDLAKGELPMSIYPYTDEFVEVDKSTDGRFLGWKLKVPGTNEIQHYEPHQIIRIYNYNPYDWMSGLSMYQPAQMAIMQDIKADIWNFNTFENDAIPGGLLTTEQELTEEQAQQIENRWCQKHGGVKNARRIAVLGKGAEFNAVAVTHKDMEFTTQKQQIMKEVLGAFGLNRIAIGDYEQINYATLVEGHKMLWEDTYIPIDESICEQVNSQWINNIDPRKKLSIKSDTSSIRILQRDLTKNIQGAKSLSEMGVTAEVALRITDVPISEDDLAKQPWLKEKPEKPQPFGVTDGEEGKPAFGKKPVKEEKSFKSTVRFTLDERDKISMDYIEKILAPGEHIFLTKMVRFLLEERNMMQDMVDEWKRKVTKAVQVPKPNIMSFLLGIDKETDRLIKQVYGQQVVSQLKAEAVRLREELGAPIEWRVTDSKVQQFISRRRPALRDINSTTMQKYGNAINDVIEEGYKNNWTVQQYTEKIKEAMGDAGEVRKNQARTIARTETAIISSGARYEAFQEEGIEYHQWINANDEKVRDTHADDSGDGGLVVKIGMPFPNTRLLFPSDPDGEAGEIINCRCVAIAKEEM